MRILDTNPPGSGESSLVAPAPSADRSPAAAYLASLAPGSRPAQRGALETVVEIATRTEGEAAAEPRSNARVRGLARGGVRGRRRVVGLGEFPWHELRHEHVVYLRSELEARFAPSTANRMLCALRGVLKAAWRMGMMDSEAYHRAADVAGVRGSREPRGRALTPAEVDAVFAACESGPGFVSARDAALLTVLYAGGLRRSEAVALDLADFEDGDEPALRVRSGKGNKERRVPLPGHAATRLRSWVRRRGFAPGALLVRSDAATGEPVRMSSQGVYMRLRVIAARAGVPRFAPHDLRRTYISTLLDAQADIGSVALLAGHESVDTTARYDRRGERARREAADRLRAPGAPGAKRSNKRQMGVK